MMKYTIIQAPMAGVSTPEFVIAASKAGILGSFGAGYLNAEQTQKAVDAIQQETEQFCVNVFVPEENNYTTAQMEEAYAIIRTYEEKLQVEEAPLPEVQQHFYTQLEVLLAAKVPYVSFTFGLPPVQWIERFKQQGTILIGTATTTKEAIANEQAGMDYIVLQGIEAGGHRGSFIEGEQVPLHELISATKPHITTPFIAAGGIATAQDVQEMLSLGAQAVQIGSALLATTESGASAIHKKTLLNSQQGDTMLTKAFSGKTARGIRNTFMEEMQTQPIAPYPAQHFLTNRMRQASAQQGNPDFVSMWSGTKGYLAQATSVENVIHQLLKL